MVWVYARADPGTTVPAIIDAMMFRRRAFVVSAVAWPAASTWALQQKSLGDPLRVGVDYALLESGLATALQRGFAADTGIAVKLERGAALTLLEALERGEIDAALTNAPEAESKLDKQGLVHDRQAIATGEFVIVGPAVRGKGKTAQDVLGAALGHDAAAALRRLKDAPPDSFVFV